LVYLLCFDKKFKHVRHYLGYTSNEHTLKSRLIHHKKGQGSKLMAAVTKAGIDFKVVRTWKDGDRNFERKLKNRKEASALCPVCKEAYKERKKRTAVLLNEKKVIEKLNAPPVVCPVIAQFEGVVTKPVPFIFVPKYDTLEDRNGKPQDVTNPSRWKRLWDRLARLFQSPKGNDVL
jgi:hypothetical protein